VKERLKKFLHSPLLWIFIAFLPALIIYSNRFLIPDTSTDSISYHVFNGTRGINNPLTPFLKTEFYPVGIGNIAPGLDIINAIVRSVLGYRLGTILSLLATLGIIVVLYKFLKLILEASKRKFHAGWGLLLVGMPIILELQFQLATYFIDILNTYFVLLVLYYLVTLLKKNKLLSLSQWSISLILTGLLLAFKLTNIPLVVPMIFLLLGNLYRYRTDVKKQDLISRLTLVIVLILLPLVPLWLQNIRLSGNPTFPYYNGIFKSIYYPSTNFLDVIFGGKTFISRALWPLFSLWQHERLGEPYQIYFGTKLFIYWITAVILLLFCLAKKIKLNLVEKSLLFYFLCSILLWGILFGITRYIIPAMAIGGLLTVILVVNSMNISNIRLRRLMLSFCTISILALGVESYRIMSFNFNYDMSWRPTLLNTKLLHRKQVRHLFDKQLSVTPKERQLINNSDVLLNCHTNVSGLLVLLPGSSNKPAYSIISDQLPQYDVMSNLSSYKIMAKKRLGLNDNIKTINWVSVVSPKDVGPTKQSCLTNISSRGGVINYDSELDSMLGDKSIHLEFIAGTLPI